VPTPEGQLFFRDVDASFVGLDRLRASAARIRDFGSGSLKVASLAALGSTLLPRAAKLFRDQHPSVTVTLTVMSSSGVRNHVADGQYDLGLAADGVDLSGVEHQLFSSVAAVCAIPGGHPLAYRKTIRPTDLDGADYIALSPEDRARLRLHQICEQAGVKPRLVAETPNSATVYALALEGVGIGIVNPLAADGFPQRGLVLRPFKPEVPFRSHLLFRPDIQKGRIVRAFVTALFKARNTRPALIRESHR
jgi:DNA-binding transcriptional LysR family regulator